MKFKFLFISLLFFFYSYSQEFKIKNDQVKVNFNYVSKDAQGTFGDFQASIFWNSENPSKSSIEGSVAANTIDTGIGLRDSHLRMKSYFHVDEYPRIKFKSKSFKKTNKGYQVIGGLTIKETTHPMTIDFTFQDKLFNGHATIYSNYYDIMTNKNREKTKVEIDFYVPVK